MAEVKNYEFQSEVKQLLNILVYSLYKNKEVFLRELISNSIDALNKVNFEILKNQDIEDKDIELRIDISFNKTKNALIIEDTGIGMTDKELVENIGTIAHSGTIEFLRKLNEQKSNDINLIGQFGVGFYSCFMVAKEVHIYTKSYKKGSKAWLWKSKGDTNYTIEETVKKTRGTKIEIILKNEDKEFLEKTRIEGIIQKHSRFVPYPIYVDGKKVETKKAIWTNSKTNLKKEDYIDFYKFIENTDEEPITYLHLSSDAPVQFNALLYVPSSSLESIGLIKLDPGVDLYSRKVLIQKGSKDLLPEYFRFIKGVIDSEEIPLNISRETIQNDIKIEKIRKHVLKKLIEHLKKLKQKEFDKYLEFWKLFSKNVKEGIVSDYENRERLADLLLFNSMNNKQDYIDLKKYKENMKKDQKEIYFATGSSIESIEKNPALEAFKTKNLDVLFLTDPIDEFVLEHLRVYDDKNFKSIESADIKVENKNEVKDKKGIENFIEYLKTIYKDKVEDVRISNRLVSGCCILVNPDNSPSIQMEKILKMVNKDYKFTKKILEINPSHELIKEMIRIHKEKPDSSDLMELTNLLLDNLLIREGVVDNIDDVILRMQNIMLKAAKKS